MWRLAYEQAHMHPLHSTIQEELFAGASSLFLLSPPFILFIFSLSPLLLSPFYFQTPIWGSARQESSHTDGMDGIQDQFAGYGRV